MQIIAHSLRIIAITAGIVLLMLLPFLPGGYDSLAVSLSTMAQLFAKVGLLLVPVGALWLVYELRSTHAQKRSAFALTALVLGTLVALLVSLGAFFDSVAFGIGVVTLWISILVSCLRRLKSLSPRAARAIALDLLVIPIAVALVQFAVADPITEFSRGRAIRNSAPLVAEIEGYRTRNGHYPLSLLAVNADYKPGVIGIKQYHYESTGNSYNVMFEPFSFRFGTQEIVMYNPLGKQAMTSHANDRLRLTPEQLALDQERGHYAVHDAKEKNWKYYWFD